MTSRGPMRKDANKEAIKQLILNLVNSSNAKQERVTDAVRVDDLPLLADTATAQWNIVGKNNDLYKSTYIDIHDLEQRILALENAVPKVPTKWYVLPLAGQSNMVGYGEIGASDLLGDMDIRIMQLSRGNVWDGCTMTADLTGYGDKFGVLRGKGEDLELIPAAPCLDHAQNMFQHSAGGTPPGNKGGTVGAGLWIAKELLSHIPSDYGILIVPCAYGGTSFGAGDWGTGSELGLAFAARVKHAMDLNPKNKLLPIVWTQGESDVVEDVASAHYTKFKEYYDWFKTQMADYIPRAAWGYKWFCCGPTKWWLGIVAQTSYVDTKINLELNTNGWAKPITRAMAVYDNYAYLSETYLDELYFMRLDVDNIGNFTPTNKESGTGATTSTRQLHFSTEGYVDFIAPNVANAILYKCGKKDALFHERPVFGRVGNVTTNNMEYFYEHDVALSVDLTTGMHLHQDFTQNSSITHNLATDSAYTISNSGSPTVEGGFLKCIGTSGYVVSNFTALPSWTTSVSFKADLAAGGTSSFVTSGYNNAAGKNSIGGVYNKERAMFISGSYKTAERINCVALSKSVTGAWHGQYDDWQTVTTTFDATTQTLKVYLNGNLVGGCSGYDGAIDRWVLGSWGSGTLPFTGLIANSRVYSRVLNEHEAYELFLVDRQGGE